jgi:RimJ/RimL family protein N-acetyltransferase
MTTPGLVFRPWRARDLDALVRHADNRRVWQMMTDRFPHPYTARHAELWIGIHMANLGPIINFAIELDGEAIGGVGVERKTDVYENTLQVGYWVGEPFWGRGVATAAATFIGDYAFEAFPAVQRLEAGVFDWNAASARVLEKAGFTFEGRLRRAVTKEGRVGDLLMYARLRPSTAP